MYQKMNILRVINTTPSFIKINVSKSEHFKSDKQTSQIITLG